MLLNRIAPTTVENLVPLPSDSPPFAINLAFAATGLVFSPLKDLSAMVLPILSNFDSPDSTIPHRRLQKTLAASIKSHFFSDNMFIVKSGR